MDFYDTYSTEEYEVADIMSYMPFTMPTLFTSYMTHQYLNMNLPVLSIPPSTSMKMNTKRSRDEYDSTSTEDTEEEDKDDKEDKEVQSLMCSAFPLTLYKPPRKRSKFGNYGCPCKIKYAQELIINDKSKIMICVICMKAKIEFCIGRRYHEVAIKVREKLKKHLTDDLREMKWHQLFTKHCLAALFTQASKQCNITYPPELQTKSSFYPTITFLNEKYALSFTSEELRRLGDMFLVDTPMKTMFHLNT